MIKNGQSIYPVSQTHHQLFFLDSYGLPQVSKLKIRIVSCLTLRVKASILSVKVFMIIDKLIMGLRIIAKLYQNITLNAN